MVLRGLDPFFFLLPSLLMLEILIPSHLHFVCVLMVWKKFKIYFVSNLFFYVFLDHFDVLILKIIFFKKNIILMYFQRK
jgi:hypothetical protein